MSAPPPPDGDWSDSLRDWWTSTDRPRLLAAERQWLDRAVRLPHAVLDVPIGSGNFLHTLHVGPERVAGAPEAPGLPVVLLHGYGQGLGCWAPMLDPLAPSLGPSRGPLYVPDLLGCGLSSKPKFTAATTEEAEAFFVCALEAWREALGLLRFALVGHSFGGYIAACYALRYPSRVHSLVLVSPAGVAGPPHEDHVAELGLAQRGLFGVMGLFHDWGVTPHGVAKCAGGVLGRWLVGGYERATGRRRGASAEEIEILTEYHHGVMAGQGSGEHALCRILCLGAAGRVPLWPRLVHELDAAIPLHFVYGGELDWVRNLTDLALPPAGGSVARAILAERSARDPKGSGQLWEVEEGSHMVMLDRPEDCARCIAAAVGGAPAPRCPEDVQPEVPADERR